MEDDAEVDGGSMAAAATSRSSWLARAATVLPELVWRVSSMDPSGAREKLITSVSDG